MNDDQFTQLLTAISEVNRGLSSVENELAKKADADVVSQQIAGVHVELAKKADTDVIMAELAKKADTDVIMAELAKKADTDVIMAELAKKADTQVIMAELGRKADTELMVELLATKADTDLLLEHIDGIQEFLESEKLEMTALMSQVGRHERSIETQQELVEGHEAWIRKHGSAAA